MKTDKTKLLKDIEAMKEKLASMEEELNKPEVFKHFPSKGEVYHFYTSSGTVCSNDSSSDDLKVNAYKTLEEANKAYNKAVAVEKVNRRILELQGEWLPNWNDVTEPKLYIVFDNDRNKFSITGWYTCKQYCPINVIKSRSLAEQIITEMNIELKIIFDIQD